MWIGALAMLMAAQPLQAADEWKALNDDKAQKHEVNVGSMVVLPGGAIQAWDRLSFPDVRKTDDGLRYVRVGMLSQYDCDRGLVAQFDRVYFDSRNAPVKREALDHKAKAVQKGSTEAKLLEAICKAAADKAAAGRPAVIRAEAARNETVKAEAAKPAGGKTESAKQEAMKSIRPALDKVLENAKAGAEPAKEAPKETVVPRKLVANPVDRAAYIAHRTKTAGRADSHYSGHPAHWSYDGEGGPENWAKLDGKNISCAIGKRQSPIDIRDGIPVDLEPIRFDYRKSTLQIIDNGHTIQVNYGPGSTIMVQNTVYELVQFHFHKPSEERVNGRGYNMVAHLVHKDPGGRLAVLAVLLEIGPENRFIQTLWNNLPLEKHRALDLPYVVIDINDLLPTSRAYYMYMGSLTTPPCSEDVLWLVLKQPVPMSGEQVGIFHRLYPMNARPVQPANGRLIKESR